MKPRKSGGNLSAEGGENDDADQFEQQEDLGQYTATGSVPGPSEADYPDYSNTSVTDSLGEILPPTNPSNRPTKRSAQLQLIDIEARKLKLLENKANGKSSTDDDEDVAFFKSLLPHVRKLKPEEKLEFRMDVQSLVQKYVYKKNKSMENSNTFRVPHTPLLGDPDTFSIQRNTSYNTNVPLAGITPLSSSYQSTPTARAQAEIVVMDYQNSNQTEVENQCSTVISTGRRYYSVITSPISSVTSQK